MEQTAFCRTIVEALRWGESSPFRRVRKIAQPIKKTPLFQGSFVCPSRAGWRLFENRFPYALSAISKKSELGFFTDRNIQPVPTGFARPALVLAFGFDPQMIPFTGLDPADLMERFFFNKSLLTFFNPSTQGFKFRFQHGGLLSPPWAAVEHHPPARNLLPLLF